MLSALTGTAISVPALPALSAVSMMGVKTIFSPATCPLPPPSIFSPPSQSPSCSNTKVLAVPFAISGKSSQERSGAATAQRDRYNVGGEQVRVEDREEPRRYVHTYSVMASPGARLYLFYSFSVALEPPDKGCCKPCIASSCHHISKRFTHS